jgi:hypothetical protein
MSALRQAINFADNPKNGEAAYSLKIRTKTGFEVKGEVVEFHSGAALIRVTDSKPVRHREAAGRDFGAQEHTTRDVFVDESAVETVEVCW